ncbi:MAG: CPBP family intramembrane metalloprotease, partial [Polyangiaceae bacterium]|nr:CPBP family intramembrane metalloprotease [Polyangiaceae bacterium]
MLLPRHALVLCLIAAVVMVLVGVLASELAGSPAAGGQAQGPATGAGPAVPPPSWFIWATAAGELSVGLVVIGAWVAWRKHLASLGAAAARAYLSVLIPTGRPSVRSALGALVLAISAAPLAELAARWVQAMLHISATSGDVVAHIVHTAGRAEFGWMLLSLALLPALVEEVLFRGVVFAAFATESLKEALLVSSLLFAAFHLDPSQMAGTFLLGLAFGLARLRSATVVTSVLAHALYNAFILLTLRFGTTGPDDDAAAVSGTSLGAGFVGLLLGLWLLFGRP